MPGIVVNTAVRTGPSTTNENPTATFFVAGVTERGPAATPKLVTSISDYETIFGDFYSAGAVHQQVQTFFEEGGAQVYVSRTVGASTSNGTLAVDAATSGTALTLTAVGPGAWSENMTASVTTLGSGHQLRVSLNGNLVYSSGEVSNATELVSRIASSSIAAKYITATVGDNVNLDDFGPQQFSAGDADESTIDDAKRIAAINAFTDDLGPGAVAYPDDGTFDSRAAIHAGLVNHASSNNRFALLAFGASDSAEAAAGSTATLSALNGSEYSAAYFPWVTMTTDSGTSLNLSPEGYVAAKRANVHNTLGSWAAYAGTKTESNFITGIVTPINKVTGNDLDENRVNALRIINGRVRIYGARSLSSDEDNYRFTTSREMLNFVVYRSQIVLEDLVFSPIDGRSSLFSKVQARLVNMLEPIRIAGGLYEAFDSQGRRIDYGYSVQVDDAINPLTQLAGGLVKAKVGIRVSSTSDQIQVDVTKSNLTASVV